MYLKPDIWKIVCQRLNACINGLSLQYTHMAGNHQRLTVPLDGAPFHQSKLLASLITGQGCLERRLAEVCCFCLELCEPDQPWLHRPDRPWLHRPDHPYILLRIQRWVTPRFSHDRGGFSCPVEESRFLHPCPKCLKQQRADKNHSILIVFQTDIWRCCERENLVPKPRGDWYRTPTLVHLVMPFIPAFSSSS